MIEIVQQDVFEGPNLWLDRPVLRVVVHGDLVTASTPDRAQTVRDQLQHLHDSLDRRKFDPLELSPPPDTLGTAWWLAWTSIGLQRLAGEDVSFFDVRIIDPAHTSEIVIECRNAQTGLLAVRLALRQLNVLRVGEQVNAELEDALTKRLAIVAASRRPSVDVGCILDAARARGIPVTSIDPRGRIHELGHGIYRRRLFNTTTSNTSAIGSSIAGDKDLSLHYLREMGLPVPETGVARDAERAVELAREIGFPVVVKPIDEGDAAGVRVDLRNEEEVRAAFAHAAAMSGSSTAVVQRHLVGREYRFLVIGGQIVGMVARVPAHVMGDGHHTVRELVELENDRPARGTRKRDRLKTIEIGEKALSMLERQGLALDDIPSEGRWVQLNATGHITAGGEAIEMTAAVHPENAEIVIAAARALEVDIAGIDLIAEDIERSIWETSGGIVEVNCGPGFWIHQFPSAGMDVDPGPAVIATLFPVGAPVRIPLVAVTGGGDTEKISRLIGRFLTVAGYAPGIAIGGELYLGDTRLGGIDGRGIAGKRRMLLNPAVEMAVLEITPEEIVEQGLAFDICDVAVVTSLSDATVPGLPPAESVVCRQVAPGGVILVPAHAPEMVEFARGFERPLVMYGTDWDAATIQHLRREGDRTVTAGEIVDGAVRLEIQWGSRPAELLRLVADAAPATIAAAVAVILALGVPDDRLRQAPPDGIDVTSIP